MVDIDEDIIGDLLIEWDQRRRHGDELSAVQLCRDCPELIPEIACRIESLKGTDWLYREPAFEEPDGLSLPPLDWTLIRSADPTLPETVIPCDEFVRRLTCSGLVAAQTLTEVQAALGPDQGQSTRFLAKELVRRKKLTPYQAEVLCLGSSQRLVLGDYEILDRLGAGGMGEVFKARHRRMKRLVALKVLPESVTDSPAALQRFQREVEVAAKLSHPNIVPAYDAREDQGTHYLITEFVDGQTLAGLVKRQGPLPVHEAVRCVRQVAMGLEYAHQRGVVHRDIKPSNLIMGEDGVVKIIDMGLARLEVPRGDELEDSTVGELTGSQTVMGTVDYMAPEQAMHTKTADARADVYSLGCTLYYLLIGRPLYNGRTALERFLAHREQPIPALHGTRDDVSAELDAVFQKMVAKRPEDRFPAMAAVIEALDGLHVSDQPSTLTAAPELPTPETDASGLAETLSQRPAIRPSAPTRSWTQQRWIGLLGAVAALVVGGLWLGGIIFKVQTPGGTIVLECAQPEINGAVVSVDGEQKLTIKVAENAEPITIQVDKGRRQLEVVKGGFKTFTNAFEINAGQEKNITVHLEPLLESPPEPQPRTPAPQTAKADATAHRRLAEWVFSLGGKITVVEAPDRPYLSAAELPATTFQVATIDFFKRKNVTNEHLATLRKLCEGIPLESLNLGETDVSHAGLGHLSGMTIRAIDPNAGSDMCYDYLKEVKGLEVLTANSVTDLGLKAIAHHRSLRTLVLVGESFGDEGVRYLDGLRELKSLSLRHARGITDQSLKYLCEQNHPDLEFLLIDGSPQITDRGVEYVGRIRSLKDLNLKFTGLTDAGLKHLHGLANLRGLAIPGAKVSAEGLEAIKAALPTCSVEWSPPAEPAPKPEAKPAAADPAVHRKAAEWVLSVGGNVSGSFKGNRPWTSPESSGPGTPPRQLPAGDFTLTYITFESEPHLGDAEIATLASLCEGIPLWCLRFRCSKSLTDAGLAELSKMSIGQLGIATDHVPLPLSQAGFRHFKKIKGLSGLHLFWPLPDSCLCEIAGISTLRDLGLPGLTTDAQLRLLRPLRAIERLTLGGNQVTDQGLKEVAQMNSLKYLALDGIEISDRGIEQLSRLQELSELLLVNSRISDEGIKGLSAWKTLKTLGLHSTQISDKGVECLGTLSGLETLDAIGTKLTDADLTSVGKLAELRRLFLMETSITDVGLKHLHGLANLRELNVQQTKVTAEGVQALKAALPNCQVTWDEPSTKDAHRLAAEFVVGLGGTVGVHPKEGEARYVSSAAELPEQPFELRNVSFYDGKSVTDAELATLARLCSGMTLDAFTINTAPITDSGLAGLLSEIKVSRDGVLSLVNVPLSGDGLKPLRGKSFRQLELAATKITDEELRYVAEVTDLDELNLTSTSVGDMGLGNLKPLAKLGVLHLGGTQVTDRGLECICNNHPGLRGLQFSRTSVTDEGMEYVARLRNLNGLSLQDTQIGDDGLKHLAALVTLETLSLIGTKVSDEGMPHLANLAKLQRLELGGTKVANEGLRHLAGLSQMKTLDLGTTPVSDEGLAHLGKLATLEELYLHETQIGDAGLPHLYGLPDLRVLSVGTTKVTDAGVAALKAALPKCDVRR